MVNLITWLSHPSRASNRLPDACGGRPPGLQTEWLLGRNQMVPFPLYSSRGLDSMRILCVWWTLPILKYLKSMAVSGCRHLKGDRLLLNSIILFGKFPCTHSCIPLPKVKVDLVCYTSRHLLLNINFFIVCISSCSLPTDRQFFAGVSWLYLHRCQGQISKVENKKGEEPQDT